MKKKQLVTYLHPALAYLSVLVILAVVWAMRNKIDRLEAALNDPQPCVWAVLMENKAGHPEGAKPVLQSGCKPDWTKAPLPTEHMYDNIDPSKRRYNLYLVFTKESQ
jgi:hypothetical protein